MSKLTKRITAMLLAGMLVIGSVPGSVLAASTDVDPGQTSEIAEEVFDEESSEVPASEEKTGEIEETSEDPVGAGETTQVEDISEVPAGEGKTTESEEIFEEPASAWETAEEASEEEEAAVQYYTITLDANGGYFENEWDDSIGDYAQQAEVVVKQIPVDGTVAAFPVANDQDGQTMVFTGWSLERDGELITMGDEEYAPVDNCVLYAVWQGTESEDDALEETGEQEIAEEKNEKPDPAQEPEEEEVVEESTETVTGEKSEESTVEEVAASEAYTDPVSYGNNTTVFLCINYSPCNPTETSSSISVPIDSVMILKYHAFFYDPWQQTISPNWELFEWDGFYWDKVDGIGGVMPGNKGVDITLGSASQYCVLINTDPDFAQDIDATLVLGDPNANPNATSNTNDTIIERVREYTSDDLYAQYNAITEDTTISGEERFHRMNSLLCNYGFTNPKEGIKYISNVIDKRYAYLMLTTDDA